MHFDGTFNRLVGRLHVGVVSRQIKQRVVGFMRWFVSQQTIDHNVAWSSVCWDGFSIVVVKQNVIWSNVRREGFGGIIVTGWSNVRRDGVDSVVATLVTFTISRLRIRGESTTDRRFFVAVC